MDLISILATVILATTIATVIMGFVAYGAFKLREKRRPTGRVALDVAADDDVTPIFFTRYVPHGIDMEPIRRDHGH